jgi:hypothetical protein
MGHDLLGGLWSSILRGHTRARGPESLCCG